MAVVGPRTSHGGSPAASGGRWATDTRSPARIASVLCSAVLPHSPILPDRQWSPNRAVAAMSGDPCPSGRARLGHLHVARMVVAVLSLRRRPRVGGFRQGGRGVGGDRGRVPRVGDYGATMKSASDQRQIGAALAAAPS